MRFDVLFDDVVIGWSELEFGDPPKGVAYGRFHPSKLYAAVRHAGPDAGLRVRPEGDGDLLAPTGGVHIEDLSTDFGQDGIEVSVLGLGGETYKRLFPHHVKSYEIQFRSR